MEAVCAPFSFEAALRIRLVVRVGLWGFLRNHVVPRATPSPRVRQSASVAVVRAIDSTSPDQVAPCSCCGYSRRARGQAAMLNFITNRGLYLKGLTPPFLALVGTLVLLRDSCSVFASSSSVSAAAAPRPAQVLSLPPRCYTPHPPRVGPTIAPASSASAAAALRPVRVLNLPPHCCSPSGPRSRSAPLLVLLVPPPATPRYCVVACVGRAWSPYAVVASLLALLAVILIYLSLIHI